MGSCAQALLSWAYAARFAETLQFINRLVHIAEAHEQRLDNLGDRP